MKKENIIGQATAEDFYEDFGNNFTRIQILSEILERKINPDDLEKKQLICQIRHFQGSLWLGFRDMLWALNDGNHTLNELITRLNHIGMEIFKDDVHSVFSLDNKITKPDYILPLHYSLNILIIFKEVVLAFSKYADISVIRMTAENTSTGEIIISLLRTAGCAMHQHLENKLDLFYIEKCARRLQAKFSIDHSLDDVIVCRLVFNLS